MTPGGGPDLFGNGIVPISWKKLKFPPINYMYSFVTCVMAHHIHFIVTYFEHKDFLELEIIMYCILFICSFYHVDRPNDSSASF